jgi:hypothetical protein
LAAAAATTTATAPKAPSAAQNTTKQNTQHVSATSLLSSIQRLFSDLGFFYNNASIKSGIFTKPSIASHLSIPKTHLPKTFFFLSTEKAKSSFSIHPLHQISFSSFGVSLKSSECGSLVQIRRSQFHSQTHTAADRLALWVWPQRETKREKGGNG